MAATAGQNITRDTKLIYLFIHEHLIFHGKQSKFSLTVLRHFQVGLAVGDIDKIQVNALIDRYVMQVEQPALQWEHDSSEYPEQYLST